MKGFNIMRMNAETAKTENGSCTYDGIDYILLQQAYADNDQLSNCGYKYTASAKKSNQWNDEDAAHYIVCWSVIDSNCDDEDSACDWSNPVSVTKI